METGRVLYHVVGVVCSRLSRGVFKARAHRRTDDVALSGQMDPVIAAPQPRLVLSHFGFAALEFGPEFMVEGMRVLSLVMMGRINGQPLDQTDQQTLIEVHTVHTSSSEVLSRMLGR